MYATIPVYYPSLEEAARKDEAALWCDSYNINMSCRNFIQDKAMRPTAPAIMRPAMNPQRNRRLRIPMANKQKQMLAVWGSPDSGCPPLSDDGAFCPR